MNVGQIDIRVNIDGPKVVTTSSAPSYRGPNAIPYDAQGRVCVAVDVSPRVWVSGIPYGTNGRICITYTGSPGVFMAGLGFSSGKLLCSTTAVPTKYVRGLPCTDDGRVCIIAPI